MCLVEVEKFPKLQTACSTVVMDGMVVRTDTEKVRKAVTGVLELMLIHHPIDCPICDQPASADCRTTTYEVGLHKSRGTTSRTRSTRRRCSTSAPDRCSDAERCILCSRCVVS